MVPWLEALPVRGRAPLASHCQREKRTAKSRKTTTMGRELRRNDMMGCWGGAFSSMMKNSRFREERGLEWVGIATIGSGQVC
jgi:hypothetical protein